jgi:hypothetical protein
MAWFNKKTDPISDRARALNQEIADLEAQIQSLDARIQADHSQPRLRSTAVPRNSAWRDSAPVSPVPAPPAAHEPIFEEVDQNLLRPRAEGAATPEHFNELGVRKYDLLALFRRVQNHFRGPSTTNPKLVSYLAAGGIQGLRPMRYEKRVARNRFIVLVAALFLIGLGIIAVYVHHR